mmetsp:Transcript_59416/g.165943  ORF Transcript_59416/g.165943 Transcript_59416/m.165943 type:complete len:233 (+) Transcript_59416:130-828(+)
MPSMPMPPRSQKVWKPTAMSSDLGIRRTTFSVCSSPFKKPRTLDNRLKRKTLFSEGCSIRFCKAPMFSNHAAKPVTSFLWASFASSAGSVIPRPHPFSMSAGMDTGESEDGFRRYGLAPMTTSTGSPCRNQDCLISFSTALKKATSLCNRDGSADGRSDASSRTSGGPAAASCAKPCSSGPRPMVRARAAESSCRRTSDRCRATGSALAFPGPSCWWAPEERLASRLSLKLA